jgi:hypothetical protein
MSIATNITELTLRARQRDILDDVPFAIWYLVTSCAQTQVAAVSNFRRTIVAQVEADMTEEQDARMRAN